MDEEFFHFYVCTGCQDPLDVRTYVKELELLVVAVGPYMGHRGP